MATDEGQQAIDGISRRRVLRGGLLAGAGVATAGAVSAVLTGTAKAASPQPGWGWCHYCGTMWWTPGKPHSACVARGAPLGPNGFQNHAVASGAYNYEIFNNVGGLNNQSNPQPGWRWCNYCQGLFWGGNSGVCAGHGIDGGDPHVAGSGASYDLHFNISGLGSTTYPQAYWRWCNACSLLYWQGSSGDLAGWCPAFDPNLGNHHHKGSGTNYDIYHVGTY